ncbi:MAG: translocation protein TolB [Cytophagales bacterium]|nr:translocation protein TolB [Cytophagales bacterium]
MSVGFLKHSIFWFVGALLIGTLSSNAQHFNTEFGQNRIQYDAFGWAYISTNSFDVYYTVGGEKYAQEAVDFLETEYPELTDKIGYAPYTKPKILIYNSIHELQQSNIGIGGDVFTIGGKTNFVKLQAEVAYPGQAHKFQADLIYELSRILISDMMYGGSLGEIFQNAYLLTLPEWFIDGAARYLAYGWDEEMDDYIRDYLGRKRIRKRLKVNAAESGLVGQSIWNFISSNYGESNLSNILNLTRIIRKEEKSIGGSLGVSYKNFLSRWQNFYVLQKEDVILEYQSPAKEEIIAHKKLRPLVTTTVRVNPLGNKAAYARVKNGHYYIYVRDLESGKEEKIAWGGYRINGQKVDTYMPLLDWQDSQTLGAIVFRRGNLFLDTYNLETNERRQKPLNRFRQIESFSFNDNGRLAVISGDVDGQNDLYLISMRRNALRRITKDVYDDLDPVFIPGSAAIVFSSNRTNDSLQVKNVSINDVTDNFNLFLYDLDTTKSSYRRLTNTYSTDRKPIPKNDYFIYYLSDQKGITNLYRFNMLDTTFSQVSSFDKGIKDYDLNFGEDEAITFMMLDKGFHKVYHNDSLDLEGNNFTKPTPRQRVKQAKFLFTRRTAAETAFTIELENDSTDLLDTMEPDDFTFEEESIDPEKTNLPPGYIDTDNFVFSDEVRDEYQPDSFFATYQKLQKNIDREGPFQYEPRFSFGNVTISFANDPLKGFGYVVQTEVSDMMENHRLIGGGFVLQDFSQADLFAEYQFLPYWADLHLRVDRKGLLIESFDNSLTQKYLLTNFEAGLSVPLTHNFRGTAAPFFTRTRFNNLQSDAVLGRDPTQPNDVTINYGGVRLALVYDNTVERSFNLFQGSRALVEYKHYQPLSAKGLFFNKLKVDLRHYQKLHREITLAGRVFYARNWGDNEPKFALGGVDNWIFNKTENFGEDDPIRPVTNEGDAINRENSNLMFLEYATNLRGYDYNEMFGSNVLVFNAEFRVPIFRYLINRPIKSNFIRNFQFTYFYDIGSAWSGVPPFAKKNAFVVDKIETGTPFTARLKDFRNPWLAGYGGGVRMSIAGYYLKVDRARPIRDFEVGNPHWYISIGVDF